MSFLERIKQQLNDPRRARGRIEVPVCRQSLMELVHHFEQLDSAARVRSDNNDDLQTRLRVILIAIYKNHHDSERLMMWIMAVMTPLIEERLKEEEYNKRLHHRDNSKKRSTDPDINNPGFLGRLKDQHPER